MDTSSQWDSFKIQGAHLLEAFKKLVHEGNVRRIVIKNGAHTVAEFPMTMGVVGVALAPAVAAVAAVAAIAALVAECTIEVERAATPDEKDKGAGAA